MTSSDGPASGGDDGVGTQYKRGRELWGRYLSLGDFRDLERAVAVFEALALEVPVTDPDRALFLSAYGSALTHRYDATGSLTDLSTAITQLTQALDLIPSDDPLRAYGLINTAAALHKRYKRTSDIVALNDAMACYDELISITPDDDPAFPRHLNDHASALVARHNATGALPDVFRAVAGFAKALASNRSDPELRQLLSGNLANALFARHDATGSQADLDEAIATFEEVIGVTSSDDPGLVGWRHNYALALLARYHDRGTLADLDAAIAELAHLVATDPTDPNLLSNHAVTLLERHDVMGDPADLDTAIAELARVLAEDDPRDPNRTNALTNHAIALATRYRLAGDLTDLNTAIDEHSRVLDLTPRTHPNRASALLNHAAVLKDRHAQKGSLADLEVAVAELSQAVALTPADSPTRSKYLAAHASALLDRFAASVDGGPLPTPGTMAPVRSELRIARNLDLALAIVEARDAVALENPHSTEYPKHLATLAHALQMRYDTLGHLDDLVEAIQTLARLIGTLTPAAEANASATRVLVDLLDDAQQLDLAVQDKIEKGLIAALPDLAPSSDVGLRRWVPVLVRLGVGRLNASGAALGLGAWVDALAHVQGLSARGAWTAAHYEPALAVELLESGAAVIASAGISQQEAILGILTSRGHAEPVNAYRRAALALPSAPNQEAAAQRLAEARSRVEDLWGAPLVASATPADLNRLVADGIPLTYLAVTPDGGIALTLTYQSDTEQPRITVTWLPKLTVERANRWTRLISMPDVGTAPLTRSAAHWRGGLSDHSPHHALTALPEEIATVIQPAASLMTAPMAGHPDALAARIVPIGVLNGLPWTAALNTDKTLVAVSLAASARLHAGAIHRETRAQHPGYDAPGHLVAITNPHLSTWTDPRHNTTAAGTAPTSPTANQLPCDGWAPRVGSIQVKQSTLEPLPHASSEGSWLAIRYRATHLDGERATLGNLTETLSNASTKALHFATHGDTPAWDPTHTHLILTNPIPTNARGPADSITTTNLPALTDLEHVFLAACWTATPSPLLPDENQSLATTFLTTGTHAVTAPLWPVEDQATGYLVRRYYTNWLDHRQPPALALAHAIHDTREKADRDFGPASPTPDPEAAAAWHITANAYNTHGGL